MADKMLEELKNNGFRLTIWNVNEFKKVAKNYKASSFRLTIWNVNKAIL